MREGTSKSESGYLFAVNGADEQECLTCKSLRKKALDTAMDFVLAIDS
jgi:hypothetical protein